MLKWAPAVDLIGDTFIARSDRCNRRILLAVIVLMLAAGTSRAQENADVARWSETAYGLSLDPPPEAKRIDQPTTGQACVWVAEHGGWTISFELVHSDTPVNIDDMTGQTLVQMGFARATPRLVREALPPAPETAAGDPAIDPAQPATDAANGNQQRLGNRPAATFYFDIDEDNRPDWFYGQALVMLEPYAAAAFKLQADAERSDEARAVFEAMLQTLHVPTALELDAVRKARVEAGQAWLETVTGFDMREALPSDQVYRMVRDGKDEGYLRVRTTSDAEELRANRLQPPGTLMRLDVRQYLSGHAMDTQSRIFASPEGSRELWSNKTTLRPQVNPRDRQPRAKLPGAEQPDEKVPTWVETGVRDGRTLTVITETPPTSDIIKQVQRNEGIANHRKAGVVAGSVDRSAWETPEVGYLPLLWTHAFADRLPPTLGEYSFYAYHGPTGKLALRTVRVVPRADGHDVYDRPSPRSGEVLSRYDTTGNLIERIFPGGVVVKPATAEELKAVWGQ